jgi:Protein of unknown function (DUF3485)
MSTIIRIWIIIGILAGVQGGITWVNQGFNPEVVAINQEALEQLPISLGDWTNQEANMLSGIEQAKINKMVGSDAALNRVYKGPRGENIQVHLAVWNDAESTIPHLPWVCCRTQGWQIAKQNTKALKGPKGRSAEIFTAEQVGSRINVLYWYQRGSLLYHGANDGRAVRHELWGQKHWPPLVKIMLTTTHDDDAEDRLMKFAPLVRDWTMQLN